MEQRVRHYDILCGVMLLFMIHHHLCGVSGLADAAIHMVPYKILYFYMAYFFYKAGIFYRENRSLKEVCKDSARRLLIPFTFFSFIGYFILGAHHSGLTINTWKFWWWPIYQMFAIGRIGGNGPLWFLLSLFIVRVIFQLTKNVKWKQYTLIILCVIVAIIGNSFSIRPCTISNVALGIIFYGLGALMREVQYNKSVGIISVCLFFGAYIWMCFFGWHLIDFSLNTTVFGIHQIWMLNCCFACVAISFLGQYLPNLRALAWTGRNSMTLLCTHALVYNTIYTYLLKDSTLSPYFCLFIYWVAIIIICIPLTFVLKNKNLGWMIGEKAQQ